MDAVQAAPLRRGSGASTRRNKVAPRRGSRRKLPAEATTSGRRETRSKSCSAWFLTKPRSWRRQLFAKPWLLPVAAMHLAAAVVQRAWRASWLRSARPAGFIVDQLARSRILSGKPPSPRAPTQAEADPGTRDKIRERRLQIAARLRQRYVNLLRKQYSVNAVHRNYRCTYTRFEDFAAAMIQGRWRCRKQLRDFRKIKFYRSMKIYQVAAFDIQRSWKRYLKWLAAEDQMFQSQRNELLRSNLIVRVSVTIQRAWRSFTNRMHYKALKDMLVALNRTGDPCLLLKTLQAREALIMDAAIQVHLRYRLGGDKFPPSIYYKVYTHSPICDVGAFAPRDYAAERNGAAGRFYERTENNGWRLLASKLYPSGMKIPDEIEKDSARKRIQGFHYSRVKRRQDVEVARKRKARDWMRKLYGIQPASVGQPAKELISSDVTGFGSEDLTTIIEGPTYCGKHNDRPQNFAHDIREREFINPSPPLLPRPPSRSTFTGRRAASLSSDNSSPSSIHQRSLVAPADNPSTARRLVLPQVIPTALGESTDCDDLIEWSKQLDFDAYLESWRRTATSNDSEGTLRASKRVSYQQLRLSPVLIASATSAMVKGSDGCHATYGEGFLTSNEAKPQISPSDNGEHLLAVAVH